MANTRTHNGSLLSDVQNEALFADASYAVRSIDSNKVCLACLVEGLNLSPHVPPLTQCSFCDQGSRLFDCPPQMGSRRYLAYIVKF